jgi:hypothetical protein
MLLDLIILIISAEENVTNYEASCLFGSNIFLSIVSSKALTTLNRCIFLDIFLHLLEDTQCQRSDVYTLSKTTAVVWEA